jgi:predicted ABC-type ATPase
LKNKNRRPNLYIIAGPNGAGKTTFARKFLPQYVECLEFVNADLIATGVSLFAPEKAALRAGRIMLEQIHSLGNQGHDLKLVPLPQL